MFSRRSPAAAAKPQQLRLADYKNTPAASASAALLIGQLIDATDQHASRSNWCMCTTCVVGKPCGPLTSQTPIVGIGYWCSHDFQRDGTIPLPSQPFLHFPFRRFPPYSVNQAWCPKNVISPSRSEQSKAKRILQFEVKITHPAVAVFTKFYDGYITKTALASCKEVSHFVGASIHK